MGQEPDGASEKMGWFNDAKLGVFIHWGIYSVDGIDESWSFYNGYLKHADYMKQLDGFTAENYRPAEWARLIKKSGAKYAVITTKHHDGVALWDTKAGPLSVVDSTPAGRDLIAPFVDALREQDLKVGLYFSHSDWSHPDYPNWTKTTKRYTDDPARWSRFMQCHTGQLEELQDNFQPDLIWFDGDWEHSAEKWDAPGIRKRLLARQPNLIINSRLRGYGDYATPEQGLPVVPPAEKWELCLTTNGSWGYQPTDTAFKSPNQIIRILSECVSMGGNLLLNIGPKSDGTIPTEQVQILEELGRWVAKHEEAIYGTVRGIPHGHFHGPTALSPDREKLYLFLPHRPNGPLIVRGLKNEVAQVRVVGSGVRLTSAVSGKPFWSSVPGILSIDLPPEQCDEQVTVVAVELKGGPIQLYRERGQAIESN